MKALSFKQPWGTLVVMGIKPIDNRSWSSSYRGPLLVHASKNWDKEGAEWIVDQFPDLKGLIYVSTHLMGKLIGRVKMIDCVKQHHSPWFFGPYGFLFEDPYEFPREEAIPYRGHQRMFNVRENLNQSFGLFRSI